MKPIVHFKGEPLYMNGIAYVEALDHPRLGHTTVCTSKIIRVLVDGFETQNSRYRKKKDETQ